MGCRQNQFSIHHHPGHGQRRAFEIASAIAVYQYEWHRHPKDISIIIGADPNFNPKGMNLTVVSATDDQGRDLWHPFGNPLGPVIIRSEFASVHDDIKSLNLKLALHKSRFVEFTVKPEKAGAATAP